MKSNVLYKNLRAEMAREGISIQEIAREIGIARETLGRKLSGKAPINLDEAFIIQRKFFPKEDICSLFEELQTQTNKVS